MDEFSDLVGNAVAQTNRGLDGSVNAPPSPAAPRIRFDLAEMEVDWDPELETLWSFMTPSDKPRFSQSMLRDLHAWQSEIQRLFATDAIPIKYVVLGSRFPGAFNLGGDLDYVAGAIERRDREALESYGNQCVDILYRNFLSLGLPVVTIALIQGDAIGGGFESALSFNVLVAERGAKFSLPENMFGMFPGVGAHSLLSRRLNVAAAERLMLSGKNYSAEEMHELGLVHVLAEPGEGEEAVRNYIRHNAKRQNGQLGVYRASREVNPISLEELRRIVRVWADTGMRLSPIHLKMMRRLAGLQDR
jgi:DSF synthase